MRFSILAVLVLAGACRRSQTEIAKCHYVVGRDSAELGRCLVNTFGWNPSDAARTARDTAFLMRLNDSLSLLTLRDSAVREESDSARERRENRVYFVLEKTESDQEGDRKGCDISGEFLTIRQCLISKNWPSTLADRAARGAVEKARLQQRDMLDR